MTKLEQRLSKIQQDFNKLLKEFNSTLLKDTEESYIDCSAVEFDEYDQYFLLINNFIANNIPPENNPIDRTTFLLLIQDLKIHASEDYEFISILKFIFDGLAYFSDSQYPELNHFVIMHDKPLLKYLILINNNYRHYNQKDLEFLLKILQEVANQLEVRQQIGSKKQDRHKIPALLIRDETPTQYTNPLLIREVRTDPLADMRPEYYLKKHGTTPNIDYLNLEQKPLPYIKALQLLESQIFSLREFIQNNCQNPTFGYYSNLSNHLGFATIATREMICRGFASAILAKSIQHWIDIGRPSKFVLVELSGGTGDAAFNILSIAKIMRDLKPDTDWSKFYQAMNFRTIEISQSLMKTQKQLCQSYVEDQKYDVINADATLQESWNQVKNLGADGHFVFSNELLDMLIPEIYMLSSDNKLLRCHVVSKIKNFAEFLSSMRELLLKSDKMQYLDQFNEICTKIASTQKDLNFFNKTLEDDVILNQETYNSLIALLFEIGPGKDENFMKKYFHHSIIRLDPNLSSEQDQALRQRLLKHNAVYLKELKDGGEVFFREEILLERIISLSLPKQQVFHFDYFNLPYKDARHDDNHSHRMFRGYPAFHYVLQENDSFTMAAPYLKDATMSVSIIMGDKMAKPQQMISHIDFMPKDNKFYQDIFMITAIKIDQFHEVGMNREFCCVGLSPTKPSSQQLYRMQRVI